MNYKRFLNSFTNERYYEYRTFIYFSYVVYRLRYEYFRFVSRHFGFLTSVFIAQYRKQRYLNPQP